MALFPDYIVDTLSSGLAGNPGGTPSWVPNPTNPPDIAINWIANQAWLKTTGLTTPAAIGITTTRASVKQVSDSNGNWTQVASNTTAISNLGRSTEEARTNQATNSAAQTVGNGWIFENNSATLQTGQGPGTGLDAYLYDDGTTAAVIHRLSPASNMSFTSGTTYACSTFVKYVNNQWQQVILPTAGFGALAYANFDILNGILGTVGAAATATITKYANGWMRLEITAPATASVGSLNTNIQAIATGTDARAATNNGNHNQFLIWNMQVETGASITSPIITAGAAVTRAADVTSLTQAFGSAYTLFEQATPQAPVGYAINQVFLSINDGTNNNRFQLYRGSGGGATSMFMASANVSQTVGVNAGASAQNASSKVAAVASATLTQACLGGVTGAAGGAVTLPVSISQLNFGSRGNGDSQLNGLAAIDAIWLTQVLTSAQLQAITT